MNNTIGLLLVVYSLVLAGLSYLVQHLAPAVARPTLIAGLSGGALCLIWGLRALAGRGGKALPVLTLIPENFALMTQTFMGWSGGSGGPQAGRTAALVITLMFVLSLAMLLRIAWSGTLFDLPAAGPATGAAPKAEIAGKHQA